MPIDVEKVERSFEWEHFKDGKPYLGTYRQEMKGRVKMHTMKVWKIIYIIILIISRVHATL